MNEYLSLFPEAQQRDILDKMNLHWTSSEEAVTDKIFMLFHRDRIAAQKSSGYENFAQTIKKFAIRRKLVLLTEFLHCRGLIKIARALMKKFRHKS